MRLMQFPAVFSRCQLSWVQTVPFTATALKTVTMTRNQLMFLSDTAFAGPRSLEHFNTDRNNKYVLHSSDRS